MGFVVYLFAFLFCLLAIFSAGVLDSTDGFQYLAIARNIYYTGEPTSPVYEYSTRENIHMNTTIAKNGKTYSFTGLGYSLSYLPAVILSDLVYKVYGVSPAVHFPLENDWLIFFTAGFTNAFWGAVLGTTFFIYFLMLGLNRKQALILSLVSIFATNLFVYTKHSMPHMMFTALIMLSFLFLKLYSKSRKRFLLVLIGVFYGLVSITYNQTFVLALLPIVLYYFLLNGWEVSLNRFRELLIDGLFVAIGFFPFIAVYFWFENLRTTSWQSFASPAFYANYVKHQAVFPVSVIMEGLHGQLFSPGRSIFIYSPVLIVVVIYWFKIKKANWPELFAFLLLALVYVVFYSAQYTPGQADQGIEGVWHGESSWGPRYLTTVVAGGMVLVGIIYKALSGRARLGIFLPLVLVGVYVESLGVLMPYQIKLHDLEPKFFLNGTEYNSAKYSNFLPRYMPIFLMSKKLVKLAQNFPKTFDHGLYNVRFYDGVDFPFNVGQERWRVIEGKGYVSFDDNNKDPIESFTIGVINHSLSAASESAKLSFSINGKSVGKGEYVLGVGERSLVNVDVPRELVRDGNNDLVVNVLFDDPSVLASKKQILGLTSFAVNDDHANLESIDVPYVSSLGPAMTGVTYRNWGGSNRDLWKYWDIHSQMYERLPDLWWIRNLYYWDISKAFILGPLLLISVCLIWFGRKVWQLSQGE